MAFGTAPFRPGDRLTFRTDWNATLWDEKAHRYRPAPGGAYTWIVEFRVYRDEPNTTYDMAQAFPLHFAVSVR